MIDVHVLSYYNAWGSSRVDGVYATPQEAEEVGRQKYADKDWQVQSFSFQPAPPAIVYTVFSGLYSDHHLDGIFSTREDAVRYIANNPGLDYPRWLEYEIGELPPHNLSAWHVMHYRNSDGVWETQVSRTEWPAAREYQEVTGFQEGTRSEWFNVTVYADDEDTARKIGAEKIAMFRAQQEGMS